MGAGSMRPEMHARAEKELKYLLPRIGPALGLLLVVYAMWDWLLDPVHAMQSGLTRVAFAGLAALAFWETPLPWSAPARARWIHWMLSAGIVLSAAQLDDGLGQGIAGVVVGLFVVPFIASGGANFISIVAPPALLYALCSLSIGTAAESLRGLLLYGAGIAVAYLQTRIALAWRIRTFAVEEKLRAEATHDALTGCYNRAWLTREAARLFGIARRYDTGLVLAMLDIDFFKRVNDTYGHQAGDEVLKAVARACSGALRESDVFGRFGGEEFFCIFPNTSYDAAHHCAERIRQAVEDMSVQVHGVTVQVTISIGLAAIGSAHATWEALQKEADEALYLAKQDGRNCVRPVGGGARFVITFQRASAE